MGIKDEDESVELTLHMTTFDCFPLAASPNWKESPFQSPAH